MLGLDYTNEMFFVVDVEVEVGFVVGIEFMKKIRLDDLNSHVSLDVLDKYLFVMIVIWEYFCLEENVTVRDEQRNSAIGFGEG